MTMQSTPYRVLASTQWHVGRHFVPTLETFAQISDKMLGSFTKKQ